MIIVLFGPMGCGKTTVGRILAARLGCRFYDADDYHSEANKQKMAAGVPLNDTDRKLWLKTLRQIIQQHVDEKADMILACSALKRKYRCLLGIDHDRIHGVYLKGSSELLWKRIAARSHEYMAPGLLQSQLETFEEPENGLTIGIEDSPLEICLTIEKQLVR